MFDHLDHGAAVSQSATLLCVLVCQDRKQTNAQSNAVRMLSTWLVPLEHAQQLP